MLFCVEVCRVGGTDVFQMLQILHFARLCWLPWLGCRPNLGLGKRLFHSLCCMMSCGNSCWIALQALRVSCSLQP
jgi:hypothetical protein